MPLWASITSGNSYLLLIPVFSSYYLIILNIYYTSNSIICYIAIMIIRINVLISTVSCIFSGRSEGHEIIGWFGLKGILKIIWFQSPCHWQGRLALDQVAQSSTQPGLGQFRIEPSPASVPVPKGLVWFFSFCVWGTNKRVTLHFSAWVWPVQNGDFLGIAVCTHHSGSLTFITQLLVHRLESLLNCLSSSVLTCLSFCLGQGKGYTGWEQNVSMFFYPCSSSLLIVWVM